MGTHDVMHAISTISTVVRGNGDAAGQILGAADEFSRMAELLPNEVDRSLAAVRFNEDENVPFVCARAMRPRCGKKQRLRLLDFRLVPVCRGTIHARECHITDDHAARACILQRDIKFRWPRSCPAHTPACHPRSPRLAQHARQRSRSMLAPA